MRKIRIIRIFFYGKLSLAKRIKKRIKIQCLYKHLLERARANNEIYNYITPEVFEKTVNAAQSYLFGTFLKP